MIAEVVETAMLASVAVLCAVSARDEIRPLLTRTGGRHGLAAAGAGLVALVAFGAIYFPVFRWLGMTMVSASDPFRAVDWPRWSIYLLLSLLPATRSLYPGILVHASWNALAVWCELAGLAAVAPSTRPDVSCSPGSNAGHASKGHELRDTPSPRAVRPGAHRSSIP